MKTICIKQQKRNSNKIFTKCSDVNLDPHYINHKVITKAKQIDSIVKQHDLQLNNDIT